MTFIQFSFVVMILVIIWQFWQMKADENKFKAAKGMISTLENLIEKQTRQLDKHLSSANKSNYDAKTFESRVQTLNAEIDELKFQNSTYKVYYDKYLELADEKTKII